MANQDKSHCMKHACTYPRAEGKCPYCKIAELEKHPVHKYNDAGHSYPTHYYTENGHDYDPKN